ISRGEASAIVFDAHQREEILLTILQSFLAWLLLLNLNLTAAEAGVLFVFWLIQFAAPSTRQAMIWVYGGWGALEIGRTARGRRAFLAPRAAKPVLLRSFASTG